MAKIIETALRLFKVEGRREKVCRRGHRFESSSKYGGYCPKCALRRTRAWQKANPKAVLDAGRRYRAKHRTPEWREANRDRLREYGRKTKARMRKRDPMLSYKSTLQAQYGLTLLTVAAMLAAQFGRCYLCTRHISIFAGKGKKNRAVVDHDGEPRERCAPSDVRALLCHPCNSGLGSGVRVGMTHPYLSERPHGSLIERMLQEEGVLQA